METDESLEHLVISEPLGLFCELLLDRSDLFCNLVVAFLHGLIVAEDRLGHLLLKIREESLDNGDHLGLCLLDPFLDGLLLLRSEGLLVCDFLAAVGELLGSGLEKGVDIVGHFVDAE